MQPDKAQTRAKTFRRLGPFAIAGLIALGIAGCALVQLRETEETVYNSKVLVGTVISSMPVDNAPIVVLAYFKQGNQCQHHRRPAGPHGP